jgi:hypothetical protein
MDQFFGFGDLPRLAMFVGNGGQQAEDLGGAISRSPSPPRTGAFSTRWRARAEVLPEPCRPIYKEPIVRPSSSIWSTAARDHAGDAGLAALAQGLQLPLLHQARQHNFGALVAPITAGEQQAVMLHCGPVEQLACGEIFCPAGHSTLRRLSPGGGSRRSPKPPYQ